MSIYYVLGGAIVDEAEYSEKQALGVLRDIIKAPRDKLFTIAGQQMRAHELQGSVKEDNAASFTPIEFGKPLTVEVRWVYTGGHPKRWGKNDMLVSSAFKSISTFDVAPRAVNLLQTAVEPYTNGEWAATGKGTPLAFYSAAVAEPATLATFEIAFDGFPDEVLARLSAAITSVGSIPVFAPQNLYFLALGWLVKLVGKAGHSLFDGEAAFSATETIAFARPGDTPSVAGWRLVTRTGDGDVLSSLRVGKGGQLVDESGKAYKGEIPYVMISLDGAPNDKYKEFAPTAASAALLDKFFRTKDRDELVLNEIIDALKVYSDFRFLFEADSLGKQLEQLEKKKNTTPDYETRKAKLEAQKKAAEDNIKEDLLKP